jgi:phosphate/sulfate permease
VVTVVVHITVSAFLLGWLTGQTRLHLSVLYPATYSGVIIGAIVGITLYVLLSAKKITHRKSFTISTIFLVVTALISFVLFAAALAENKRHKVYKSFGPGEIISNSFFRSLRETPKEYQFYLHAAALKDCKPYAWSYSEMEFYLLPDSVAPNVLPSDWVKRCNIKRDG